LSALPRRDGDRARPPSDHGVADRHCLRRLLVQVEIVAIGAAWYWVTDGVRRSIGIAVFAAAVVVPVRRDRRGPVAFRLMPRG
jgi:hypothetical protein